MLRVPLSREASMNKLPDTEDTGDVVGSPPTPGPKDLSLGFDLVSNGFLFVVPRAKKDRRKIIPR